MLLIGIPDIICRLHWEFFLSVNVFSDGKNKISLSFNHGVHDAWLPQDGKAMDAVNKSPVWLVILNWLMINKAITKPRKESIGKVDWQ